MTFRTILVIAIAALGAVATAQATDRDAMQREALAVAANATDRITVPLDFRDEVFYWAFTDRFANGDASNDNGDLSRPGDTLNLSNPLGWHGGDFAGIRQKIEEGYFQRMGFTALWISPVVFQVPPTGNGGGPNQNQIFVGYHGYWAEDFLRIEPHFGTVEELRSLVELAHSRNIKIIIDVIVNHSGVGSTLVAAQPDWFRTGSECGSNEVTQCLAGLPDFIQTNSAASDYLDETIRFLRDEVGMDGFRMDTMKHVNDVYWESFFQVGGPGDPSKVWTVGEVFDGDVSKMARYMDELGSPSVFDFPLYFAINDAVARNGGAAPLVNVFAQDGVYDDPSNLSLFVDNHDLKRFVSEALSAGSNRAQALERLDAALSLIYTARGIPFVYYGTEIGMEGEGDPYSLPLGQSNREDMRFDELDASSLDERLAALGKAHARYPALRRGTQTVLWPVGASGCGVADTGLDPAAAFGAELFVRGSFNGWAAVPGSGNFVNLDDQVYAAELSMSQGPHQYKIAAGDWSVELGVADGVTVLDEPQPIEPLMGGPGGNADIVIEQGGCHRWEIDVTDLETPLLTVARTGDAADADDLLAFVRLLEGERPVLALLNVGNEAIDLADLPGGGLPVLGLLNGEEPLVEITGIAGDFAVSAGRVTGTVPPRSLRAVANKPGPAGVGAASSRETAAMPVCLSRQGCRSYERASSLAPASIME
ncbi:MAG: alpha-amylase family glycosyl hydrolase [Pseudomonadota bacterium]